MSEESIAKVLEHVRPFSEVGQSARLALAAASALKTLSAGETLFREGDAGRFVFVVTRGILEVRKVSPSGRPVLLRKMGPGEVGGLTSTTTGGARSASLRARDEATVLTIDSDEFIRLASSHQDLMSALLRFLSGKVRSGTSRLAAAMDGEEADGRTPIAFFDAKPYDRQVFDRELGSDLSPRYFEARLGPDTVTLAEGVRVVCAFVNDDLGTETLERLAGGGTQLIALRCAGFNNVDLEAAARLGLEVVRVPAYSPHAVAEHAVALLLAINRRIHRAYTRVREGNFSLSGLVGFDLFGRTAGIVGAGTIGRCLAEILRGFGMTVLAYDAFPDEEWANRAGVAFGDLEVLLERSDVVSLHAPLTPETFHMIDTARLERIKPGAILLNTGRGALVDTAALIGALKSGRLGGAGLDVYEEESGYFFEDRSDQVITDDVLARLMTFPNVIVTSHQAFLTEEALRAIAQTTASSIRDFLASRPLANRVTLSG